MKKRAESPIPTKVTEITTRLEYSEKYIVSYIIYNFNEIYKY